ncbi:hypothetical protein HELRODRAFT_159600 [Helobdella robusta]|uniref:Uncharacterized protein n=1 Tax=Helobdella robusta TaxID=6412 RepID=T1EP82_HELRO|nr:hypothetical protein HELRODRAFT_159600 [Helobdella robusta]ESO13005.1 hypothetical protein HELRODRAFT_159600 [Helobdella robusta]
MYDMIKSKILKRIVTNAAASLQLQLEEYQNGNNNGNNYLLKLKVNNDPEVKLNMTFNPFVPCAFEVKLGKDTNKQSNVSTLDPWTKFPPNDFVAYQDREKRAAFLKFPDSSIQGTLTIQEKEYFIQPESDKKRRRKKRSVIQYTAKEVQQNTLAVPPDTRIVGSVQNSAKLTSYLNSAKDQKMSYISEIVMMIDYTLYQSWYNLTSASLPMDKRQDQAINQIRYYYANIANSTPDAVPFVSMINVKGKPAMDTYKTLDNLPLWLDANKPLQYDNFLFITECVILAFFKNSDFKLIPFINNFQYS